MIEQQRRIHELESRAEQEQASEPRAARIEEPRQQPDAPRQQEVVRTEPAAFPRTPEPEAPRAPAYESPKVDPKKILDEAGLVMIETDRAKAPQAQYVPEEPAQLGRPRRERQRPAQTAEEALQQVETKR